MFNQTYAIAEAAYAAQQRWQQPAQQHQGPQGGEGTAGPGGASNPLAGTLFWRWAFKVGATWGVGWLVDQLACLFERPVFSCPGAGG